MVMVEPRGSTSGSLMMCIAFSKGCQIAHMKTQSLGKFSVALTGRLWESFFFWTGRHLLEFFFGVFWHGNRPPLEEVPNQKCDLSLDGHQLQVRLQELGIICLEFFFAPRVRSDAKGQSSNFSRRGVLIDAAVVAASITVL